MSDETEEYPLSDGELSFSRWRSNNTSQTRVRPSIAHQSDDSAIDFPVQFVIHPHKQDGELPGLAERRGVNVTISPQSVWDSAQSSAVSSPSSNYAVSDEEFEKEFGFTPSSTLGHTDDPHEGLINRQHSIRLSSNPVHALEEDSYQRSREEEEHGSDGSSELSFQDMVERQADNLMLSGRPVFLTVLRTLFYISIWYFFSTGLTIYNKKLLGAKLWDFPAPLLMNTVHFSMQAVISWLILRYFSPSMRPTSSISWKDYFVRVVPTGVATALDVDLTNASLVFISVSFETMCKSAGPVFLLLFAFAFKLEVPSFRLFGIILVISSGVLLTGLGSLLNTKPEEQKFEVLGFILVMLAAVMSGFRWTVTQILLQKKEFGLNNPFAVMSQLAPVMALLTGVLSVASEPWHKLREHPFFDTYDDAIKSVLLLLLGGSLAFFMVLAEYFLISKTSAVTLTVAGVVKEVVTIMVAVIFLGDDFSVMKGVGLGVIMLGVCWYNWFKYQKFKEGTPGDDVGSEKLPIRYIRLIDRRKEDEVMHTY
ncbi:hypothetical protein KP509_29G050600 [Ceratopteris richardii]|uniref:Sugar phosphate transporter domain-containing protein n=1 Tax=Ceratopteris richardii TaxID=49495 RepID=A0A8T2R8I7_CERRI|nr:hypothetical protein KP509_29G050600 [Ceratopteris richardii]